MPDVNYGCGGRVGERVAATSSKILGVSLESN